MMSSLRRRRLPTALQDTRTWASSSYGPAKLGSCTLECCHLEVQETTLFGSFGASKLTCRANDLHSQAVACLPWLQPVKIFTIFLRAPSELSCLLTSIIPELLWPVVFLSAQELTPCKKLRTVRAVVLVSTLQSTVFNALPCGQAWVLQAGTVCAQSAQSLKREECRRRLQCMRFLNVKPIDYKILNALGLEDLSCLSSNYKAQLDLPWGPLMMQ